MVKFIETVKKYYARVFTVAIAGVCWDKVMQKHKFTYARYMNDLMVLATTKAN
jgi:hypothetical protein